MKSVNVCMIKMAQDLGSVQYREALSGFGFDTSSWRSDRSDALQLANAALGKTIPVNIQTLSKAYAILANKGNVLSGNSDRVLSEESAETVTKMLVEVVERGTGKRAAISDTKVAGKTGTMVDDSNAEPSHLALFAGYVPADAPRYVSIVVIENGYLENSQQRGYGGTLAAPVFHNVLSRALSID